MSDFCEQSLLIIHLIKFTYYEEYEASNLKRNSTVECKQTDLILMKTELENRQYHKTMEHVWTNEKYNYNNHNGERWENDSCR